MPENVSESANVQPAKSQGSPPDQAPKNNAGINPMLLQALLSQQGSGVNPLLMQLLLSRQSGSENAVNPLLLQALQQQPQNSGGIDNLALLQALGGGGEVFQNNALLQSLLGGGGANNSNAALLQSLLQGTQTQTPAPQAKSTFSEEQLTQIAQLLDSRFAHTPKGNSVPLERIKEVFASVLPHLDDQAKLRVQRAIMRLDNT